MQKQFDNVVVLTLGLNAVAADYEEIYEGDPTFDVAYQAFKDKSESIILYEEAIASLIQKRMSSASRRAVTSCYGHRPSRSSACRVWISSNCALGIGKTSLNRR